MWSIVIWKSIWVEAPLSIYQTPGEVDPDRQANSSSNLKDKSESSRLLILSIIFCVIPLSSWCWICSANCCKNYYIWLEVCFAKSMGLLPMPLDFHDLEKASYFVAFSKTLIFVKNYGFLAKRLHCPLGIRIYSHMKQWTSSSSLLLSSPADHIFSDTMWNFIYSNNWKIFF